MPSRPELSTVVLLTLFVVQLGLAGPAHGGGGDWQRALERGEVLAYDQAASGCASREVVAKAIIDAPLARVWPLVDRCGDYQRLMPRVKRSKELSRAGGKVVCLLTVDMPFPYADLTSITDGLHHTAGAVWTRRWQLRSGDYKVNRGGWELSRYRGAADRTLVVYRACVEPRAWVPGWIRSMAQRRTLPRMLRNMRRALGAKAPPK